MSDRLSDDLASLRIDRDEPSPPSVLRRALFPVLVVVALGVAGFVGYQKVSARVFKQEVQTTEIALVSPSQAQVLVTATGYVIPQRTSKVGSKLPGRLAKVLVKEGDSVDAGALIAQLEDADQKSAIVAAHSRVGVAKASVQTAHANLAEVTQEVEREKRLVASGAVGKAKLDGLLARQKALAEAVRAAQAQAHSARADVGTFRVGLDERSIIAPLSGRIVGKPATVGEFVGGVGGLGVVAEIVDFKSLMVETDVPEARLHAVKLGGPAEIVLDAYPNKRFRGEAKELGLRVNRSKATVTVKVAFVDDPVNVLPEMSARVSFLSKAITDEALKEKAKMVVAKSAVVTRGGTPGVFVIEDGKLRHTRVEVGPPVSDAAIELLDGPPPGSKVALKPSEKTTDGQRVKESAP